jgi:hypothetical protein
MTRSSITKFKALRVLESIMANDRAMTVCPIRIRTGKLAKSHSDSIKVCHLAFNEKAF